MREEEDEDDERKQNTEDGAQVWIVSSHGQPSEKISTTDVELGH